MNGSAIYASGSPEPPKRTPRLAHVEHYLLAVVLVGIAMGVALLLQHFHFRDGAIPLLLFAGALSSWYGGTGPAVLAVILSLMGFDYFFVVPLYSFTVEPAEFPYLIIFAAFAALISSFVIVRRRVEEELEERSSLLDLTHDSVSVRDMNFLITYWNKGAEEFYGWTRREAIGKRSDLLLHTVFPKPVEEIRTELLRTDRWDGEVQRTKADGIHVIVATRWSLRRDPQGRPLAILETSNDITGRKQREEEIQALNQELATRSSELEASNKELEAFAYSISHDLRAPLRHMAAFAELLRKNAAASLNEKSSHYLTMILEATNRMGNLIDDLLGFSRISRGEAHYSTVNLAQLVQEAIAEVRQDATNRNIAWKIEPLPEWYGDRSMLRTALVNLISNAVKFTRTRPQAEIEIGCTERRNDHVVVFVRDNGVGFDMKYYNKLFGVFQRLHPQEAFEGTGIGLATVQRVVRRHGGRVWAESIVDGGATFWFSLSRIEGR